MSILTMGTTRRIKTIIPGFSRLLLLATVLFNLGIATAKANTLESVTYSTLPRTRRNLPTRTHPIGIAIAHSITAITAKDKMRVILNLTEVVPYAVSTEGNNVLITLDSESTSNLFAAGTSTSGTTAATSQRYSDVRKGVNNIDFRRGENGEGRVVVTLTESNIPMDINEEFGKVVVKLLGRPARIDRVHRAPDAGCARLRNTRQNAQQF